MKKEQNFKNHGKLVYLYHIGTFLTAFVLLILAIVQIFYSSEDNFYLSILFAIGIFALVLSVFYTRVFALKAQDRAIKAEESIRHFIMTQKPLDRRLTIRQIIGLRFASDEEYLELSKRAIDEGLTEKQIKQSIKNWKGDYYRV